MELCLCELGIVGKGLENAARNLQGLMAAKFLEKLYLSIIMQLDQTFRSDRHLFL
jgi:hypothetical protein